MSEQSTILLDKRVIELLKKAKEYPRETYNEIIERMAITFISSKKKDQYDKFLHEIQKEKIKEIWDNKYDEIWEKV